MKTQRFAYFLRTLLFPRVSVNFTCEYPESSLLNRLNAAKEKHGELVSGVIIDNYSRKFWIEAGIYKNITTFRGIYAENEKGCVIGGSFVNSGTWISYPLLILSCLSLVYLSTIQEDTSKMYAYLLFFAILHLFILMSFNIHSTNIIKFMNDRLQIRPAS